MTVEDSAAPPARPASDRPTYAGYAGGGARTELIAEDVNRDRVSLGAIIVGFIVAVALQALLTMLGAAWGLATIDPTEEMNPFAGLGMGTGLWWLVTSVISLFAGGWIAGRTSGLPYAPSAVAHGVAVWALATIAALWMGATALTTTVTAAANAAGAAASAAGDVAEAAGASAEDAASALARTQIADRVANDVEEALEQRDLVVDDIRGELREMYRTVVSEQERRRAANVAEDAAVEILRTPGDYTSDVSTVLDRLFGGDRAVFNSEDRQELERALRDRFGVTEREAARIADRWEERWEQATNRVETALDEAAQDAAQFGEAASERAASLSLGAFFASFFGLLAAAIGAALAHPDMFVTRARVETAAATPTA